MLHGQLPEVLAMTSTSGHDGLWVRINSFPLKLFLSGCFIQATGKETKIGASLLGCQVWQFSQGPPKEQQFSPNRNVTFLYNKGLTSLGQFRRKLAQGGQCLPLVYCRCFGGQNAEHRHELLTCCVPCSRHVPQQTTLGDGWAGRAVFLSRGLANASVASCAFGGRLLPGSSPSPQQIPLEVGRGGGCNQTG